MSDRDKAILDYLDRQERILKSRLQFYVRYRLEIKEGLGYVDSKINDCLDELKIIWEARKIMNND